MEAHVAMPPLPVEAGGDACARHERCEQGLLARGRDVDDLGPLALHGVGDRDGPAIARTSSPQSPAWPPPRG
jgi:hypothetical protein